LYLPFSLRGEKQDEDDIKVGFYDIQLFYASYPDTHDWLTERLLVTITTLGRWRNLVSKTLFTLILNAIVQQWQKQETYFWLLHNILEHRVWK